MTPILQKVLPASRPTPRGSVQLGLEWVRGTSGLTPALSPRRGSRYSRLSTILTIRLPAPPRVAQHAANVSPSPGGEGRGEGESSSRFTFTCRFPHHLCPT